MSNGVLVLLGSGETAPGMTKVHREILAAFTSLDTVNLDTAYGFQLNVPQMSEKLEEYFNVSLETTLTTLHFASFNRASELERTLFKQQVRGANYVFAGPGSPTYALAQWHPLHFGDDLLDVLNHGGTVCFASAAALTLGAFTAPIYEVYKVGVEEPQWREGLNVLAAFGLNCVVIPHFDNNEGGNYDTRFCYLGEKRLLELEAQLPDGVATLGVDEHTAVIVNLADDTVTVKGRSNGYWRLNGVTTVLANATTTSLDALRTLEPTRTRPARNAPATSTKGPFALGELAATGGEEGIEALARLVQLATTGGPGFIDPTPLVEGILRARESARAHAQYELADELRDALLKAGIDVHDGPDGTAWTLREVVRSARSRSSST
ncbi:MAG: CysS/YqeB C-terminal domain-containing protein [Acidimicrobiales bacterium]